MGMAAGGLSTGKLFLAGIGPGLMLCAAMCILVARITRKRGYPRGPKYTVRESLKIVSDGFLGVMTIVIILLGVCTGFIYNHRKCCNRMCIRFICYLIYLQEH